MKEIKGLKPFYEEGKLEAGLDESGIGSAFSRLYTAVVIWPHELTAEVDPRVAYINDSKKLSPKKRYDIVEFIKNYAIDYAISYVEHDTIDEINVYHANQSSLHNSLDSLTIQPESIIVDGNKFKPYYDSKNRMDPYTTIVKGDNKYKSISAASILAKTTR